MTGSELTLQWLDVNGGPAVCRSQQLPDRAAAGCVLVGHARVPTAVRQAGATVLSTMDATAGRVVGLGQFVDPTLAAFVSRYLRGSLDVRPRFEWYACRGAGFHNDAHYGGVLFGAWCVSGPRRDIVFARTGLRAAVGAQDFVVFDPFEPHAVLDPDSDTYVRERYLEAEPNLFIGFEIELTVAACNSFAISAVVDGAVELSSRVPINPETGALP